MSEFAVPGWAPLSAGKVRELLVPAEGEQDTVLVVASDRISAYDHVLSTPIPDKGEILTRMSRWWFEQLADLVEVHVLDADVPAEVAGRAMLCRRLDMFPVECVARGYLTGSGLVDYRATGSIGGNPLPAGLDEADRLEPAIYTPATKAELGDHDENIDYAATVDLIGAEDASALRSLTLEIYTRAAEIARERGLILADTKLEFGRGREGGIVLGDEVLTPDSSRFWDAREYRSGAVQPSFDKQIVRNWLTSPDSGWDRASDTPPPALPPEIVERTRARYIEAYERLTGTTF